MCADGWRGQSSSQRHPAKATQRGPRVAADTSRIWLRFQRKQRRLRSSTRMRAHARPHLLLRPPHTLRWMDGWMKWGFPFSVLCERTLTLYHHNNTHNPHHATTRGNKIAENIWRKTQRAAINPSALSHYYFFHKRLHRWEV